MKGFRPNVWLGGIGFPSFPAWSPWLHQGTRPIFALNYPSWCASGSRSRRPMVRLTPFWPLRICSGGQWPQAARCRLPTACSPRISTNPPRASIRRRSLHHPRHGKAGTLDSRLFCASWEEAFVKIDKAPGIYPGWPLFLSWDPFNSPLGLPCIQVTVSDKAIRPLWIELLQKTFQPFETCQQITSI